MKKSLLLMACLGVCACVLAACAKGKVFSAGTEMSAEEIGLYRERLQAKKEEAKAEASVPAVENEEVVEESDEGLEDCYYTENGTVWHADRDCAYLKRSQNILQGSVEGAAIAGKTRPCSSCAAAYIE